MKLSELENHDLFNYMLFYNKMTDEEKNKINFVVYKNHLMYLKENNTEKYNYYYTFLEKMLYDINTSFDKERNIEINSINDIVILFMRIVLVMIGKLWLRTKEEIEIVMMMHPEYRNYSIRRNN